VPAPAPEVALPLPDVAALTSADAGQRAAVLRRLQPLVGNAALARVIARQPEAPVQEPPAPAAPTGDVLQDALAELRASTELIDRNTAEAIDGGSMSVRYLDEVPDDPDSDALLEGWGFDKTLYFVKVCPNGEQLVIQRNAQGTAHDECGTSWLFVARGVTVARMREILVHETNHAMRLDEGEDADSIERYKDEFQAYWVAEFRSVADLDDRARQIREHILRDYPALKARYDTDDDFKAEVDAHTRPDGNVINSLRWRRVLEAAAGLGTDEEAIFTAIGEMSAEEKEAARNDPNFTSVLHDELSGEELERALALLGP
jgi:hypothetical protein